MTPLFLVALLLQTQDYQAEGLKARPITRDLDWGIPVPVEGWDDKRLYVWFEAVVVSKGAAVALGRAERTMNAFALLKSSVL